MVYDSDRVTVEIGPIIVDGFARGEQVRVERDADAFTRYVGNQGHVCWSKTGNKCLNITLMLMQGSAANDAMSVLLAGDELAPNGAGIVPCFVRDRSGRSIHGSAFARIVRWPAASYGDESGTREWLIQTADAEHFVGGN